MLNVAVLDKKYNIFTQFTRDIIIEEIGDNYFIFKGSKAYEYTIFYKYTPGANDSTISLNSKISFDGENYYDVYIYNRQIDNNIIVDTPYQLKILLPSSSSDTITGYYVLTVPAVIEFCRIDIDGLVDGNLDIIVGATK